MKYDVITFGSATLDVFLRTQDFCFHQEGKFLSQKAVCFPFSSKADINDLAFRTGGGGTNAGATLALQGLKTAYCGMIADDFSGNEVLRDLKGFGVDDSLILKTDKARTNFSVIFSWGIDRTAFIWRGASELLKWKDAPQNRIKAEWLYLAPFSGKLVNLFAPLVNFAHKNKIKVFANLGDTQINLGIKKLKPILKKIDVVLLNQEEASLLTKIAYQEEEKLFKKLDEWVDGLVIMTKGREGAVASDGNYLYRIKSLPAKIVEKTGAGDAFGSGFLSVILRSGDIEAALQFGAANAASCIQKLGAKQGLLKESQRWKRIEVEKKKL